MAQNEADYMEGLRLFYLQKYDEAAALLTRTAEAGDAKAQHFLAMMYENGNGIECDFAKAAYWYGRTAAQGDREAQLTYAMICALGKGVEADLAAACHWATRALHQGNAKARQTLDILRAQAGAEAAKATEAFKAAQQSGDLDEAARQLEIAAECGSANAQFALSQLLYEGQGDIAADRDAALLWLRDAAALGHEAAQKRLAELEAVEAAEELLS